jgi:hypothetical protein
MVLFESTAWLHVLLGDHQNTVRDVIESAFGTLENHLVTTHTANSSRKPAAARIPRSTASPASRSTPLSACNTTSTAGTTQPQVAG